MIDARLPGRWRQGDGVFAPNLQDLFKLFQYKQLLIYEDILPLLTEVARFLHYLFVDKLLHWGAR